MVLQYSSLSNEVKEVENRLIHLSLQYSMEQNESITEPVLVESKIEYSGSEEINAFLDKLEGEREQWYYCNC